MTEDKTNGVYLRVGDIGFGLVSADPSLRVEAQGAARCFVAPRSEQDVRMRAAWSNSHDPAPGEKLFDAGSIWSLYRQDGGYLFRFTVPRYGAEPYKTARFNDDFTSGELFLNGGCFPRNQPLYPLECPLDELLMINLLARGRGVEFHASAVRDSNGDGYLFLGPSGAGKSTTARLWRERPGVQVLSEDRVILRRSDGRFRIYGTPWNGELTSCLSAEVKGLFFVAHGPQNEFVSLGAPEVVSRLMLCSFVPFFSHEGLEFTLSFLQQIVQSVPCMEYRFVPGAHAVDFVRDYIARR